MNERLAVQVSKQWFVAIYCLQEQEIGNFRNATPARMRQLSGERLATLVQETMHITDVTGQRRVSIDVQHGRNVSPIQYHKIVGAPFDDAYEAQRGIGVCRVALESEP